MEWLKQMNHAVDYIEAHLEGKSDYAGIAKAACCSPYHFQRIFSFLAEMPLSEYIRRRKMTLAAFELQSSGIKVIDLALKYGYDSPEAFTRVFHQIHGIPPTSARRQGAPLKAYPRISFQLTVKGAIEMSYKIVNRPAFQMYGIEEIFDTAEGKNFTAIPAFWNQIRQDGRYDALVRSSGFPCVPSSICGYREMEGSAFSYLIGMPLTPLSETKDFTVIDVPASTWAVFWNEPHRIEETPAQLQALIKRFYADWLPTADYVLLGGYDMELYFRDADGNCYEEIWMRVKPNQ